MPSVTSADYSRCRESLTPVDYSTFFVLRTYFFFTRLIFFISFIPDFFISLAQKGTNFVARFYSITSLECNSWYSRIFIVLLRISLSIFNISIKDNSEERSTRSIQMQIIFINEITKYLKLSRYSVLFFITILYNYNSYYFTIYIFVILRLYKMWDFRFRFEQKSTLRLTIFIRSLVFKSNAGENAIYTFQSDDISFMRYVEFEL